MVINKVASKVVPNGVTFETNLINNKAKTTSLLLF